MKRKLTRWISVLLLLSLLLSSFAVLALADEAEPGEDEGEPTEEDEITLLLYRNFSEGWSIDNGLPIAGGKGGNFHIASEDTPDFNINYYFAVETQGALDAFATMGGVSAKNVVVQFDIKAKDYCNSGSLYTRVPSSTSAPVVAMYTISQGRLYLPAEDSSGRQEVATLSDSWLHIAYVFDFIDYGLHTEEHTGIVRLKIYYGPSDTFDYADPSTYTTYNSIWRRSESQSSYAMTGLEMLRFGFPQDGTPGRSDSYCLDNIAYYYGTSDLIDAETLESRYGCGSYVNDKAAKTVPIISAGGALEYTDYQYVQEGLLMKNKVEYALRNDVRIPILTNENGVAYGAPQIVDGKVMLPLQAILDYIGYPVYIHSDNTSYDISTGSGASYITIGRDTASINGERVKLAAAPKLLTDAAGIPYATVCLEDVSALFSGYYATYDDMGLTIICRKENVYNRQDDLEVMVEWMKKFIFDYPTGEQVYEDVKAKSNNFSHPFLLGTQETFDGLRDVYALGQAAKNDPTIRYDEDYYRYADRMATGAKTYFEKYALLDGDGNYLGIKPELYTPDPALKTTRNVDSWFHSQYLLYNVYETRYGGTNYGYDPDGGRNNLAPNIATRLRWIAASYMVTRDIRYAELAYDIAYQLGTWETWGEGHFLNCADTTAPYAQTFDMLYNTWKELGESGAKSKTFNKVYDVDAIAQVIYDLGISKGYISCFGRFKISRTASDGTPSISGSFMNSKNNWNAVCTSGMMIGALAIMEYCDDEGTVLAPNAVAIDCVTNAATTARGQIFATVQKIMFTLAESGMEEYAPDGGYIESPSYWAYGTCNFFEMVLCMMNAGGTDYGYMDCWGIDTTCEFAVQTEFPYGRTTSIWPYHDSSYQTQSKEMFYFVGDFYGDMGLVSIRKKQIDESASDSVIDIMDCITYKPSYAEIDTHQVSPKLDYYGEGISLVCSRSEWEQGCIYTGIMGGANDCPHNQIDAGNIIYVNKNIAWFCELGADDYNTWRYFSADWRNRYYRMGGEGQNVVIVTSQHDRIPYGQTYTGSGNIEKTCFNEYGSYAIMDLLSCYDGYVNKAKRGMLFTNNRKTVVYQDEIGFKSVESYAWIAHVKVGAGISITISEDGQTAYLQSIDPVSGQFITIRCTIQATIADKYQFAVMDCYTYLLNTIDTLNPLAENSLKYCNVNEKDRWDFRRLVVTGTGASLELAIVVEEVDDMEDTREVGYHYMPMEEWEPKAAPDAAGEIEVEELTPEIGWIMKYTNGAKRYIDANYAFTTRYMDFFGEMHMVAVALKTYPIERFQGIPEVANAYAIYVNYLARQQQFAWELNTVVDVNAVIADSLCGFLK